MKKSIIWVLLLGAGFSLFAQTNSNTSIFIPPISGISKNQGDNEVIATMLANEIKSRKGVLGNSLEKADYILYGTIAPYHEEEQYYHDYIYLNTRDPSNPVTVYTYNSLLQYSPNQVYIFQLILKNEKADEAMLLQNLLYHSIDDVYDFFPLLIYNIFSKINIKQTPSQGSETEDWRNKWLYLRASFDFPITFYFLKPDGLIAGTGIYNDSVSPMLVDQLDNKVVMLPALTLGVEIQLLNWLSVEPNVQAAWEYLNDEDFINLTAGLQLKFPLKFIRNIMLEPYGAVSYPVFSSSKNVFDSFPTLAFGGGFQLGMKGWKDTGSVFLDINYMYYYLGDAVMYNPYGELFPKPELIHYQRSVLGLGIGYKFGIINRK
ncbi:MAG: hypothetical protein LBB89_13035 [Treponema sp.]|jgi:hypothetical protein|nr:hypothetical protein [Treponema sp.]